MADSDEVLLKAELLLERMREKADTKEARRIRRRRRTRRVMNRIIRILAGWLAVVVGAAVFSATVAPLGFWGILIVPLLLLLVTLLLLRWPAGSPEALPPLEKVEGQVLAPQLEAWLDARRPALPAPARSEVDRILVQLDSLGPELARVGAGRAEATDAQRLMADHLPRLVESYEAIPLAVRNREPEAGRQLAAGLRVVGDELRRINDRLAAERLEALEAEGRFLENRWRDTKRLEG